MLTLTVLISAFLWRDNLGLKTEMSILQWKLDEKESKSIIVFFGNNPINGAWYAINISCALWIPYGFESLPEDKSVEIFLQEDCKKMSISKEAINILTKKKFSYVYWDLHYVGSGIDKYHLSPEEAKKIAEAPWGILAITWFDKNLAWIFRNTKNPFRKWYEPTWTREIYTEEDNKKCNALWGNALQEWKEKEWKIATEKVLKCYKEVE